MPMVFEFARRDRKIHVILDRKEKFARFGAWMNITKSERKG